jgi:hypothetical protein
MDLQKLGLLMSGIASTTSRDPRYLQTNLAMQDSFQEMKERERMEAEREKQDLLLRRLANPTSQDMIGTPQTKAFEVNGRMVGQNAPAQMQQVMPDDMRLRSLQRAFPKEFLAAEMQQRLAGPAKPIAVGENDRLVDPFTGKVVLDAMPKAPTPTRGVVVNGRLVDPITGRTIADYSDKTENRSLAQMFEDRFGTKLEPGMRPVMGADGNFDPSGRQEPAPGTSKDPAVIQAQRREALQADMPNARSRYLALTQPIRALVSQIPAIKNDPNTKDVVGVYEGGTNDEKLRLNPFTAQGNATAASRIENLRNVAQSIGLNIVRAGGVAPGSVTEREWPKFESFVANIDTRQGEEEFLKQIGKAEEMGNSLLASMRSEFKNTYGVDPEGQSAPAKTGPEYLKSLLDKYPARN